MKKQLAIKLDISAELVDPSDLPELHKELNERISYKLRNQNRILKLNKLINDLIVKRISIEAQIEAISIEIDILNSSIPNLAKDIDESLERIANSKFFKL